MPLVATVAQIVVLFGLTLIIVFADRAYRNRRPPELMESIPPAEPGIGQMLLLTVLCNIAALPVYFYQTRNKGLWALVGFAAFLFCFGASVVTGIVVTLVMGLVG